MANAFERVKDEPTQKESVDFGPAPELKRRQLIFDSLRKIADHVDPGSRKTIDSSGGTYVYTWGAGYHGQLGRKFMRGQKKYASVPQYVAFPENVAIRQVACGGLHTAAVSDEGQVFTWGDGRMGQLGQVHEGFVNQPTPRAVRALTAFVMAVACGQSHTIVLTDKGKLWSWGFSRYGQTGHGDRQMVKIPKLIDTERSVEFVQIACGDKHSVALSRNGKVYSFGCGEHGQLGHGDQSDQLRPIIIQTLSTARIVSVRCGAIFTCMITESGELYVCGFGEYFYQNTDHNFMYLPRKFSFSTRISQVSCGQSHIVALSARGEVYTVGAGEYGQLGHGVRGNLSVPRLIIASKDIVQVAAGRYHSLALTNFGAIYSWGNNDNGQLGQDTDDNLLFPRVVEHILGSVVGMIQCGEHHSVALTSVKWTSLGHDVHEWFLGQKQEQILKLRYLKKTNYGLGKKELGKIKEEMLQWTKSRQKTREQTKEEEVRDTRAQLESIQTRQSMTAEISEQVESVHNLRRIRESPALRPAQEGPPELDSSLQGANSAPGKHIITVSEQQQRSRQKRSKILSKQLVALLSSRNEARQIADGASLPLIPHTDRPSANSSPQAADSPLVPALPSARTLFLRESAQMVTRMTSALTERHESDSDAHIRNTFAIVCALRKEYDAQRSKVVEKQSLLHRLQREVQYITTSTRAMETAQAQYEERLKGLEMQLDTVTIKINETEENRKNYELNIAHLKEEELDRFFQMEALRKQRAEINALYRKMNTLKNQAQIEQEQAAHEFEQFQSEIISFHQFAVDQLQSFQNVLTVLKAQRKKRQLQKADRENKTIDKFNSKIERMLGKIRAKENQANDLHKVLDGLNAQITEQKETLQRIAAATGFEKPDDIINKFYLKEEIKLDLEKEIQEKTKLLEATQQKKNDLLQRLEEEKSNFTNSRWRDVDQLQEKFRETCARADKTKIQADKATQRMALLQEGISGLLHVVAKVIGSDFDESWLESGTTWTAEKFNQVLGAFETSILTLKQSVDEATKDQDESALTRQGIKGIPYVPAYGDVDETVTELGENALSGKGLDSSAEAALEGASGSLGSGSKKKAKSAPKSPKLMARSFPGNKPFIKS